MKLGTKKWVKADNSEIGNKQEDSFGYSLSLALAAIMLALLIAMVPVVNAQTEIEGQKGLFMILSYITLGLSLLLFIFAFVYLLKRRKAGVVIWKRRAKEEEIIEMIREIKELKRRVEERGENLTSLSDVFLLKFLSSLR